MDLVNRSAIIVKPRQPYLDWMKLDDSEGLAESVFETLRTEPHVYLLPEYVDPTSRKEILEDYWPALFEAMLSGWLRDPGCWPRKRSSEMFNEWFEFQMTSMVEDLDQDEPLDFIE